MQASRNFDRIRHGSFTLVELLAAMAVLSILVLMLAGMVNQAFRQLTQGQNQAQTLQTLRAVSHMIGQDMQGAILPLNPTNQTSFQFVQNPDGTGAYQNHDAIFWQTAVVNNSTNSDIACVGYFVMWDTTNPRPVAKLCRFYDDSTDIVNYYNYTNSTGEWISDTFLQNVAPATSTHDYKGMLAENVIGFWVNFGAVDALGNPVTPPLSNPFNSRTDHRLPTDATLTYAFVNPSAAQRITAGEIPQIQSACSSYTTNSPSSFINNLPASLRPEVHIYSTRVLFRTSN